MDLKYNNQINTKYIEADGQRHNKIFKPQSHTKKMRDDQRMIVIINKG
jgi:hypothetical protein